MKRYIVKSILVLSLVAGLIGCKDFLDVMPKTSLVEETAFVTYDNFKTYSWSLYNDLFGGFSWKGSYEVGANNTDAKTDNMIYGKSGAQSEYAYQLKVHPSNDDNWTFDFVRKVNIMLRNIDKSKMDDRGKNHWRSVGYFFRAVRYYSLISDYGDVPWIDQVVGETDYDIIYGKRTPRKEVADNVLEDLKFAEKNIIPQGDGVNTVNLDVVLAFMSRFCLFEGTWRKYHGLGDHEKYLKECIRVSAILADKHPTLASYEDTYVSQDLKNVKGILLFREYLAGLTEHSIGRVIRTAAWYYDLTKDAVDSYLCSDGKPFTAKLAANEVTDTDIYEQFRNRDHRLYLTVIPPHRVNGVQGTNVKEWERNEEFSEYIDLMATISDNNRKQLPTSNFAGNLCPSAPHFRKNSGDAPFNQGYICSELGFYFWKYYNTFQTNQALQADTEDWPLFTMAEVLLNYAEAACEMEELTQSIVEKTINKLRAPNRANIDDMVIDDIGVDFDPARDKGGYDAKDYEVNPLLWEVRRERRIELMGDGFRLRDLRRWKKGHYLNKRPLGIWIKKSERNAYRADKVTTHNGLDEGYAVYYGEPEGWLEQYYLEPVPPTQIALNPNLLPNNPGWERDIDNELMSGGQ